ncbi:tyrosine-type recombinase/integrase [Escherichia coli]|nr:tyrosine-type recombinase/integrase [Escherichia coli]
MKNRKYLTHYEVNQLLLASRQGPNPVRNTCMIMFAYLHGLRASELISLRLSDIESGAKSICIKRLKNGFSTVHPIHTEELKILHEWLLIRTKWIEARRLESDYLFISTMGKNISRQQFYNILSSTGKQAGLSIAVHPHMLRHACGYALADNGIDTRLIQDYLGHRNIRHTVIYTASNSARFARLWKKQKKEKKQLFWP